MKKTIKIKKILLAGIICSLIILSGVSSGCIKNILTDKNDQSPWPRFQADQYATGCSKYLGPQTNNVKWRFSIDGWSSSPIIGPDDNQSNPVKIIAPPNGGCYLGAYNWGGDGIQTFEQVLGRKVAIGNPYPIDDGGCENTWPSFDTHGHEQNWQAGYATWTGIETALGWAAPKFIPQDVIDGEIDSYLTQMAEDIRDWGRPIFWMYPREPSVQPDSGYDGGGYGPNGDLLEEEAMTQGYSSTAEYGDPEKLDGPERYIDMCRHIHDVVVPIAPNVTWVMGAVVTQAWVENRVSGTYEKYYPGDVYVDWHAFDIYGWSGNSDDPESPLDAGFFTNIIEPGWSEAVMLAPDKPIMIVEFGVYANVASGDDRSKWFNNFFQAAKSTYSQVGAFIYWQSSGSDDTGIYTGIYTGDLAEDDIFNEMKGPDAGWWLSSVVTSSIIEVEIIKPKENYLYVFDEEVSPTLLSNTIIVGKITISINAYSENKVEKVEFYIDDVLKNTDYDMPYECLLDEFAFGNHEVKVIAYDNKGNNAKDKMEVKIFNLG